MITEASAESATRLLEELLWKIRLGGVVESSRNGSVITIPGPTYFTLYNPLKRLITDPRRDANPFFHCMEFVWMMAGQNDVDWIKEFNSNIVQYADESTGKIHGAYGARWRTWFHEDQLIKVAELLKASPDTRRAVLGIWDPMEDLENHNDLPCNTHIYFRKRADNLDMTVCNRSNDLIWGALGANIVHMTLLHELMSEEVGLIPGYYSVFTNNLHMYSEREDYKKMIEATDIGSFDIYKKDNVQPTTILRINETMEEFLQDCDSMVLWDLQNGLKTQWMYNVARPIKLAWEQRKNKSGDYKATLELIEADDWRIACTEWVERHDAIKNRECN